MENDVFIGLDGDDTLKELMININGVFVSFPINNDNIKIVKDYLIETLRTISMIDEDYSWMNDVHYDESYLEKAKENQIKIERSEKNKGFIKKINGLQDLLKYTQPPHSGDDSDVDNEDNKKAL